MFNCSHYSFKISQSWREGDFFLVLTRNLHIKPHFSWRVIKKWLMESALPIFPRPITTKSTSRARLLFWLQFCVTLSRIERRLAHHQASLSLFSLSYFSVTQPADDTNRSLFNPTAHHPAAWEPDFSCAGILLELVKVDLIIIYIVTLAHTQAG